MTAMASREARVYPPTEIDGALMAKSRDFCRETTKREAKNFYYGLKLLPEPKRSAMYALYAYMRLVDDIADDESNGRTVAQRRGDLDQWEALTREAIGWGEGKGDVPRGHILWPAFADMVRAYRVPAKVFEDMIAGQRQDIEPAGGTGPGGGGVMIPDFAALYDYCYRVASVVGVASLYVWGFEGGEATLKLGVERGVAFQLTNILRDLREDSARGRCYVPANELAQFGVTAESIGRGEASPAFTELMKYQVERAESFYGSSGALEERVQMDSRPTLRAMTGIYHGLLERIAEEPSRVLRERVRLSTWAKLMIGWKAMRVRT